MSITTLEDAQDHNPRLIRKALEGSIFIKPWAKTDAEIEKIYTAAGGLIIPTGYVDVGVIAKDQAVQWDRETETADVNSWSYAEPTRRDLVKDVVTMAFNMHESKNRVFELWHGVDLSAVTADSDGNIVIDKPKTPQARRYRVFQLAKDGDGADAVYFMRCLPNAQVTGVGGQKWGDDAELVYPITMTGSFDPDWGTSQREIWGGPGVSATDMGFTA